MFRLRGDEIAIGDDHDSVLAAPRHDLRSVMDRPFDDLAESSLASWSFHASIALISRDSHPF